MTPSNRFDQAGLEFLQEANALLAWPTVEGAKKRTGTDRPVWQEDPDHYAAMRRHLARYDAGEKFDADSGCHALVHVAWRCLALAYQETR